MRKPRIIFFDIDGTEPDRDDYFAVAKSTVPVSPDFDTMAFGADNSLMSIHQRKNTRRAFCCCRSHPAGVVVSVF